MVKFIGLNLHEKSLELNSLISILDFKHRLIKLTGLQNLIFEETCVASWSAGSLLTEQKGSKKLPIYWCSPLVKLLRLVVTVDSK